MRELDENFVYDLSDLTSDEYNIFLKETDNEDVKQRFDYYYHAFFSKNLKEDSNVVNAKELFYTLENIQVDCRALSEEQIKEMADVYTSNGFKIGSLNLVGGYFFIRNNFGKYCLVAPKDYTKNTITYEKFMELFGNIKKSEEFKKLVEVLNEELSEEVSEPQYEVTMIAEKPKHPLTPVFDKAEEISENIQNVLKAYKETSNKLNYELDFNFITQLAERMAQNKHKYEPYNWQKLDNIYELKQALFRHVLEVMKGNYEDDNRLFGHLESIALNCMFINYQLNKLNENNKV